jgi:hypothetical protein
MKRDDLLYFEVDDSCALCGLRGIQLLTIHHIDGERRNNSYENQIVLCHNCHRRFHEGKGVSEAHIRERKRHLIHKTLTTHGLNALKIAARNKFGVVAAPFMLYHVVDLGYMEKREIVMGYGADHVNLEPNRPDEVLTQQDAMVRFAITPPGKRLLAEWFQS